MQRRLLARGCAAVIVPSALGLASAAQTAPIRGICNWIHSTGDAERAFAFYHDVFGIELARSPFAGGGIESTRLDPGFFAPGPLRVEKAITVARDSSSASSRTSAGSRDRTATHDGGRHSRPPGTRPR
jgi:hypothetical protein